MQETPPLKEKVLELEGLVRALQEALRTQTGALEHRLADVERRLAPGTLPAGTGARGKHADQGKEIQKEGLPAGTGADLLPTPVPKPEKPEEDEVVEYEVAGTVWNVGAIIGLPGVSWDTSVVLFVNLLLNVCVQVYICSVLVTGNGFLNHRAFKDLIPAMKYWRSTVGHELQQADARGTSLTSRLCAGDKSLSVASHQAQLLEEINDYLGLEPDEVPADVHAGDWGDGPLLCACCLFVFMVIVVRELQQVVFCARAFAQMKKAMYSRVEDGAFIAIAKVRFLGIAAVTLVRASVAWMILVSGSLWLASTSSTTDLVLNAAALGFVMDLDEYLWQATVPKCVQSFAQRLKPLRLRKPPFNMEAIIPLGIAAVMTLAMMLTVVKTNMKDMADVKRALCAGEKDFLLTLSAAGVMNSKPGEPFDESYEEGSLRFRALDELINPSHTQPPQLSVYHTDHLEFGREARADLSTYASQFPCADMDVYSSGVVLYTMPALVAAVWDVVGLHSDSTPADRNFSCAEVAEFCQAHGIVRSICSVTCGCASITSGLFYAKPILGCPNICVANLKEQVAALPCEDTEVTSSTNWSKYWGQLNKWLAENLPADIRPSGEAFAKTAMEQGCEIDTLVWRETADFCDDDNQLLEKFGIGSVIGFCPAKCCSGTKTPALCPRACSANSTIG